jgi:hypothetical protein
MFLETHDFLQVQAFQLIEPEWSGHPFNKGVRNDKTIIKKEEVFSTKRRNHQEPFLNSCCPNVFKRVQTSSDKITTWDDKVLPSVVACGNQVFCKKFTREKKIIFSNFSLELLRKDQKQILENQFFENIFGTVHKISLSNSKK